jgi:hypothetical protein
MEDPSLSYFEKNATSLAVNCLTCRVVQKFMLELFGARITRINWRSVVENLSLDSPPLLFNLLDLASCSSATNPLGMQRPDQHNRKDNGTFRKQTLNDATLYLAQLQKWLFDTYKAGHLTADTLAVYKTNALRTIDFMESHPAT